MAPLKRPGATLIGVPPPPPIRRSSPTLPEVFGARADLPFSRTVLASAPEAVPEELQAAVLVPAPPPPTPAPASRAHAAAPAAAPPKEPGPAPYPALPVERTPAIAVASLDVPVVAKRPQPGFRTGVAVAVAAVGVATGLGLTLLIGHGTREAPAAAASPHSSPVARAPSAPARQRSAEKPKAQATETAAASVQEAPSAPVSRATDEFLVPVSSTTMPSCREMLGAGFMAEDDPKAALAETQLANRELVRGNAQASQAAFCRAALWDSEKIERWLNLAQIFLIRRDDKKALESVERALELDAKNARALEILGDAQARLGRLDEARKAYLDAERRPEPDDDARKWLVRRDMDEAQRSMRARDFVRAERLFRRVVAFEPEHPGAALGVSMCLRKLDAGKAADAWAERAEKLARRAAGKGS